MLKLVLRTALLLIGAAGLNIALQAQEQATPDEVVQKVKDAAKYLGEAGETGLEKFQSKDSEYVWKDTYVNVTNCEMGQIAAHPIRPELAGSPWADVPSFGDLTGPQLGALLCETGQRPQGGWVKYLFPKPGEKEPSRKLSYSKAVENTPYIVTGGIYSDNVTIEELEKIITE